MLVPVDSLIAADSPRLSGEDREYVRVLAESEAVLPPILVHRSSMRIIDGMHRLRAAQLRGEQTILVRYFNGDAETAFLLAVRENVTHGLPLTSADRAAAAGRIIRSRPDWSDRAIASATSLSAKTVAEIRRRATAESAQLSARVGLDGRTRPLDATEGRRRASELISARPGASLREIAREAGISPGTVRDVRERLRTGRDPIPMPRGRSSKAQPGRPDRPGAVQVPAVVMPRLRQDPSMRFNELGRTLLRLLDAHLVDDQDWQQLVDNVPEHCADTVSALATICAQKWQKCAEQLDRRASHTS